MREKSSSKGDSDPKVGGFETKRKNPLSGPRGQRKIGES